MAIITYVLAAAVLWWIGMAITAAIGLGVLPFVLIAALLASLKLAGIFVGSWWWAILPIWGALGGAAVKMWVASRDPQRRART